MITVTVTLPPGVDSKIVDAISVTVLDDTRDRQPRGTYLEGIERNTEATYLEFTT